MLNKSEKRQVACMLDGVNKVRELCEDWAGGARDFDYTEVFKKLDGIHGNLLHLSNKHKED